MCKQLHVPAQSGSSTVLARMRRGYTREAYDALVCSIRSAIPGVRILERRQRKQRRRKGKGKGGGGELQEAGGGNESEKGGEEEKERGLEEDGGKKGFELRVWN